MSLNVERHGESIHALSVDIHTLEIDKQIYE